MNRIKIDLTEFYEVMRDCDSDGEILMFAPGSDNNRGLLLEIHLGPDDRRVREFIKGCIRAYRDDYAVVRRTDGRA